MKIGHRDSRVNTSSRSDGSIRAGINLPAVPESLSAARTFVGSTLEKWNCVDRDQVVALLTSEIVSNVVRHAGGNVELEMAIVGDHVLRVQASDECPDSPVLQRSELRSEGGRGLLIVDRLARRWGVEKYERHKVVWFETDLLPRARVAALT